jgi:hypothetical protein
LRQDTDIVLLRKIETTTAKLHDHQIDLSAEGEVVLRDRGYFGVQAKGIDFAMERRTTEKPLEEIDRERNRLISVLRSPGERPHAVIKRVFRAGKVLVTTMKRAYVKMMVTAFAFNLYQIYTLKKCQYYLDLAGAIEMTEREGKSRKIDIIKVILLSPPQITFQTRVNRNFELISLIL